MNQVSLTSQSTDQESVSRRKFLRKIALATAAGAGVAGAETILRSPIVAAAGGNQVLVSSTDAAPGYLNPKIAAGWRIATSILNPTGTQQLQISVSDEVMPAAYVIYQSGSTTFARNGLTGKDDYTGIDPTIVIQNAINALPSSGGLIFIRAGTYSISPSSYQQAPIAVPSGVTLQGEGIDRTILKTDPQSTIPPTTPPTFQTPGFFGAKYPGTPTPSSQVSNITIRDMTLQSNAPPGQPTPTGGYFFIASYGANALRFERLKLLGGGDTGTGVFEFGGTGGQSGNYSNIQFVDVWADTLGTTNGNEFLVFAEYNLSNIKFKRCCLRNTSGPNVGFYQIAGESNVSFRDCIVDTGGIYMGVFGNTLPVIGRLLFDDCYFLNWIGFGTGGSPTFQFIEVSFRGCISETPFVRGDGIYHTYLSDSWVLGTKGGPLGSSSGYVSTSGNLTIRGGGLVDGWNIPNPPNGQLGWYNGGSAIAISTGQSALSELLFDVSGFRIGIPAPGQTAGGIIFNYAPPPVPQNLRMKMVASFMPSNIYQGILNGQQGGPTTVSGLNWLSQLVATGFMPNKHTLVGCTDEMGNRYAYPYPPIATLSVGPSPFTYQNNDGVSEAILILGGSVSQVVKNGVTLYTTTNVTVWLEPGESVTVTYTSAPSMFKDMK